MYRDNTAVRERLEIDQVGIVCTTGMHMNIFIVDVGQRIVYTYVFACRWEKTMAATTV
jgi:hypothetical protein